MEMHPGHGQHPGMKPVTHVKTSSPAVASNPSSLKLRRHAPDVAASAHRTPTKTPPPPASTAVKAAKPADDTTNIWGSAEANDFIKVPRAFIYLRGLLAGD